MKLRAFVVMPFGTRQVNVGGPNPTPVDVDFESVYNELLVPALVEADCDPVRADSETANWLHPIRPRTS
jgi:hypothetical protein